MIQKTTIAAVIAFFGIMLMACFQTAVAAENWKLEDEENGIKSYSRTVEDSKYHAFKATITIDVTMAQLGVVLRDVKQRINLAWQKCINAAMPAGIILGADVFPEDSGKFL